MPSVSATEKVLARPSVRSTNFRGRAEAWKVAVSAWFPVPMRTSSTATMAAKPKLSASACASLLAAHQAVRRSPSTSCSGWKWAGVLACSYQSVACTKPSRGDGREDDSEEQAEGHGGETVRPSIAHLGASTPVVERGRAPPRVVGPLP